jgi:hypothetical protein
MKKDPDGVLTEISHIIHIFSKNSGKYSHFSQKSASFNTLFNIRNTIMSWVYAIFKISSRKSQVNAQDVPYSCNLAPFIVDLMCLVRGELGKRKKSYVKIRKSQISFEFHYV